MKRIVFGIAMAIVPLFSACDSLVSQEDVISEVDSEKVVLTASLGSETKVYLEQESSSVFKVRWDEGDDFIVIDRNVDPAEVQDWDPFVGFFELENGVGKSTAEFVLTDGVLPDEYYAFYGDIEPEEKTGQWMTWISDDQYREVYVSDSGENIYSFAKWDYPMYAVGSGNNISFRNICAVLKVSVTGNGEQLEMVQVSTLDEDVYLAGDARLYLSESGATISIVNEDIGDYEVDVYDKIGFFPVGGNLDLDTKLSDKPIECQIIIPAQTYPSGLKISLVTDKGHMEMTTAENLKFEASELREVPVIEYSSTTSYDGTWRVDHNTTDLPVLFTEREGDYLVLKNHYIDEYDSISFYDGNSQEYGLDDKYNGYQFTNTCVQLKTDGNAMSFRHSGYYDIYLDPEKLQVFVMSAGIGLDEIPTMDEIACHDYYMITELADETQVKVYGQVQAVTTTGFILSLNGYDSPISVYVSGSAQEQVASLSSIEVGDYVELYAIKYTYALLPELYKVTWSKIYKYSGEEHFIGNDAYNITSEFDAFPAHSYMFIRYYGTLIKSGGNYFVSVENQERYGYIVDPVQDLSAYDGKKVLVEGYNAGWLDDLYLQTFLTKIALPDYDGSNEDVIPDDDIVVETIAK